VEIIPGGDVILRTENCLTVFVYRETGELNSMAKSLLPGDEIIVIGAIKPSSKYGKIIDAERIEILSLSNKVEYRNPKCPICGHSSESIGKNKGYRCRKCGYKFSSEKEIIEISRDISLGTYQTRYYRHLTKPIFLEFYNNYRKETEILNKILNVLLRN
ncbi:MAG: tRNA(Ile2) 2-agmatinylcytidine synthetase TiaS, partial [Acidianus infernus]|nr:tRNA(Ile2) 2-agmatinylcytidine synthetase TiaS [Acidianus infernus]